MKNISISNFMGFSHFENPSPFPGITVIVGKNDTGKTGLLKLLYAVGKANEQYYRINKHDNNANYEKILSQKLYNVFQPRKSGLSDLIKEGSSSMLEAKVTTNDNTISFSFGKSAKTEIPHIQALPETVVEDKNYLFIPTKEVLTAFNSIKTMNLIYYFPGFDETFTDIIQSLDTPTIENHLSDDFAKVRNTFIDLFGGEIIQVDSTDRFIFKRNSSEYSMQQTAEGIKKIGTLTTLIKNRQLVDNTVLFLDEPETCLHPNAIRLIINMLALLVKSGVQIFLTTHNYYVLKQLYIVAQRENQDILCCSLEKADEEIKSSFTNLKEDFPENAIGDEMMYMYDEEIDAILINPLISKK